MLFDVQQNTASDRGILNKIDDVIQEENDLLFWDQDDIIQKFEDTKMLNMHELTMIATSTQDKRKTEATTVQLQLSHQQAGLISINNNTHKDC